MNKMWRCRKDGKSGAVCVRLASIYGDSPDDEIRYVMAEDSGTAQEIATERFDAVEGEMRCYSEQLRRYNKKKGLRMMVNFDAAGLEVMGDVHIEAVAAKAQALANAEEIEKLHAHLTQVSLSLGATQGHLDLVDSLLHGRTDRLSPKVRVVINATQPPGSPTDNKRMWSCSLLLKERQIVLTEVSLDETSVPHVGFLYPAHEPNEVIRYATHVLKALYGIMADLTKTQILYKESGTQVPQEGPDMPGGPHLWRCWYANADTKEITCKCLGKQKASFAAFGECIVLAYRGSEAEELAKERLASR